MRHAFLPLLLALPLCGRAETVFVEYQGTVSHVGDACWAGDTGYSVGDPIQGVLKIDTGLAPPARTNTQPSIGAYLALDTGVDFISGFGGPVNQPKGTMQDDRRDAVVVGDRGSLSPSDPNYGLPEYYELDDLSWNPEGGRTLLVLGVRSTSPDLVSGTGIEQTIDAHAGDDGVEFFGSLQRIFRSAVYNIEIALTHLSVTPGACHAP